MSDDIHFQTAFLPLTLHSMRLALSLLAFSSLAAADGNVDGGWSSATNLPGNALSLVSNAVENTKLSDYTGKPYVCASDISSLCTKSLNGRTTYLFGISGCNVQSPVGACPGSSLHDSCTSSSFLVLIGPPKDIVKSVNSDQILPNMCDTQANLVNRTSLYWMYFVTLGKLDAKYQVKACLTNCQSSNFLLLSDDYCNWSEK